MNYFIEHLELQRGQLRHGFRDE